MKKVSDIIVDVLSKQTKIFTGYSGGAILPTLDSVYKNRTKFITTSHEQGAGHVSEIIGKLNGLGVVITTSGPGVTNLVTSMQNALTDNNPVIYITGQVSTNVIGTDAFQECDATKITNSCTKMSYQLKTPDLTDSLIKYSVRLAKGEIDGRKGPVHIDLPKNIQSMESNTNSSINMDLKIINSNPSHYDKIPNNHDDIKKICDMLSNSKKPVLYVGKGCNHSHKKLLKFAELLKIPVTTTLHGLGSFPETHYLSLKMVGMHGSVSANYAIQNSDLILCVGARFDDRTIGNPNLYAPNAKKIHVDIDKNRINKLKNLIKPHLSIFDDSDKFFDKILDNITYKESIRQSELRSEWINTVMKWKKNYKFLPPNVDFLTTQNVIFELDKYLTFHNKKKDTIITTGVGNHQMFTAQFINWTFPNKFLTSGSLGVMGTCLPFGIGAKLVSTDQVICIDGDSSFNMSYNELKTLLEHNIKIKIMIMNDGVQQMVQAWQDLFYDGRHISTSNVNPDYVKLAEAHNIKGIRCSDINKLRDTIKYFMEYPDSIICDFRVKGTLCLPFVAPGNALDNIIIEKSNMSNFDKSNPPS